MRMGEVEQTHVIRAHGCHSPDLRVTVHTLSAGGRRHHDRQHGIGTKCSVNVPNPQTHRNHMQASWVSRVKRYDARLIRLRSAFIDSTKRGTTTSDRENGEQGRRHQLQTKPRGPALTDRNSITAIDRCPAGRRPRPARKGASRSVGGHGEAKLIQGGNFTAGDGAMNLTNRSRVKHAKKG